MRITLLLLALWLLAAVGPAAAQIDTTRARYYRPVFANVTVTSGVTYGSAVDYMGIMQSLQMDIYQPAGDTVKRRPLVIFAHQGGFFLGSRTDPYMVAVCTRLARLGYVAASIDYRLGFTATGIASPADTVSLAQAAFRGMQDMKAVVRFFRKDAATTKTYHVHASYIVAAGSSAGAFLALETGYLDKASKVPDYIGLAALGGIEGQSGTPGYSSAVLAVINLSGATQSASYIEAGNVPLCSVHGTRDMTVPYLQGKIGSVLPPKYVVGSGRLNPRATAVGVPNTLRPLRGAGHIPFEINAAYADTTFWTIRDFLRPLLQRPGTPLAARSATVGPTAQAYPVPAQDAIQLVIPAAWRQLGEAQLLDMTGRVVRRLDLRTADLRVMRGALTPGVYLLRFPGQVPLRLVFE